MTSVMDKLSLVRQQEGNDTCAECGDTNPEWCCLNRGVFLCITCAGIHRRLHSSLVRSCRLDPWNEEMVDSITEKGNLKAKAVWEAHVPPCWVRPSPSSRYVCKEQWIWAKYDRKEFLSASNDKRPYLSGVKQGSLYKRMKQADMWNSRWFVLADGYLAYFKSYQDRTAKALIKLMHLNVVMNGPALDYHPNSMLISFWDEKTRKTRNIFVYAELGKDIMDWYCAIRSAKIKLMLQLIPELTMKEASQRATWDYSIWGYLCKMPPTQKKFQKRFFVLDKSSLRYYETPYDPFPLGEIYLSASVGGYWVDDDVPTKLKHFTNIFMLHTPSRSKGGFPLLAEDASSKLAWMSALQEAVKTNKAIRSFSDSAILVPHRDNFETEDSFSKSVATVY